MKGSAHLTIGVAIGAAATAYYPFTFTNAAIYMAVAAFSALSADLDGTSMLTSKLSQASKLLRNLILWGSTLLAAVFGYMYFIYDSMVPELAVAAIITFLLGFVAKQGLIRNCMISAIGGGLIYAGLRFGMNWLIGFGLFIAWVPWLKHRGMTHTLWAALIWGAIGRGLESQLELEGIAVVATAGYLSHLLADTLTPSGVKWFYPLYKKSIKLRG
ncbi:metal-dependent hydrolase [Paenibacillus nasutitermitis]|uniref:Membrane protein n=1 Tax=Paenibacillus nasutitermitis TaxID=1652958 RepID=A0A917DSP1_9BACL|nr:metal-dependent hydrolase [Paenibacillus nasutitermitis]GGD63370.1 membrane protein [Paenibacillus nasutitermitis]